jgi:hypothetical protein
MTATMTSSSSAELIDDTQLTNLVESMCMTMRHDFGLDSHPDHPLDAGMTDAQRNGLRNSMRQLVHHHVLPLLVSARQAAAPAGQAATKKYVNLDTLAMRIFSAQLGSCTCMTKAPDLQYHSQGCRYRVLAECSVVVAAATSEDEGLARHG